MDPKMGKVNIYFFKICVNVKKFLKIDCAIRKSMQKSKNPYPTFSKKKFLIMRNNQSGASHAKVQNFYPLPIGQFFIKFKNINPTNY